MRHLLTLAAALAVGGLFAATTARAELLYYQGGPVKQGNMCQISTDPELNYGYWAPCPAAPARAKATRAALRAYDRAPAGGGLLYYQGGPVKQGTMCQISTDPELNYGYWAPCAK